MGQCVTKMQNVCEYSQDHKEMIDEPVVQVVEATVQAAMDAIIDVIIQEAESDKAARMSIQDEYFVDPKQQVSHAEFDAELDSEFEINFESDVETTVEEGEGDFALLTSTIANPQPLENKAQIG